MRRTAADILSSYQRGLQGGQYLHDGNVAGILVAKLHDMYPNASDDEIAKVMKSYGIDENEYKK